MVDRGYVVAVGVVVVADVSTTTGVGAGGSSRPTAATVLPLGFSNTTMFHVVTISHLTEHSHLSDYTLL